MALSWDRHPPLSMIVSNDAPAERRAMFTLLYRQIKENNDRARRLAKKLEGHRKLMRYEQRAVNQIRKVARIKK